ncbi:MAG TPA: triphosphoribosyl-dephospho-CoA synthase [Acetobacteraceae bacterium]|nr:triphosphoribosyl-dephospho-CoA synthase [Acetobacteraceae bacterium]
MIAAASVAAAFLGACADELEAPKPGNVHRFAAGHGMRVADFRASAASAAPALCRPDASLGARIEGAVRATRRAIGQNTNLGIVLLCAPLAMAAEAGDRLRPALCGVIDAATPADAASVFRAIALAAPGGLGHVRRHDVRARPAIALREAMAAASGRDRIAAQWAGGFADVFGIGLPCLRAEAARGRDRRWATLAVYLRFLAAFPDSHIARRHGARAAEAVRARAAGFANRLSAVADPIVLLSDLLAWDAALKRARRNPGTSADLTVATLFAARLEELLADRGC